MTVNDIQEAAARYKIEHGKKPAFVLLTEQQLHGLVKDALRLGLREPRIREHPPEILGMMIVRSGERFHQFLQEAGVPLLQPNTQANRTNPQG